ncbi:EcoAI/FtnUII family type I restriction enzme subunit R [Thiothrix subterranea]|uniref:DEAD/DEAH box helicase family protein n=1 Tax=Thiothrix subterranea TaxID=2735563 RepID=A0AA51ML75_9GAMM|nr:DEAD/DEAH box helicase family protein [Thiothrix subterranea]MDQ5769963.1 DEAD/DEAH box helicase family protein [Thiothrix subterranea]WML86008.1 DEAD/DEAH box helicase family protein [Thiothrix subterranea]
MIPELNHNEAKTRRKLIDKKLYTAQWEEIPTSDIDDEYVITPGPLIGGGQHGTPRKADYVLVYKGKKLAVIEAKRVRRDPTEGVQQAKDYATLLNTPFAYATNGKEIYRINMKTGQECYVDCYPTPDELWHMVYAQESDWRNKFAQIGFETKSGTWKPRYYQHNAIEAALEALISGKDRILLTLATGTGKTAIAFQIAWKLFHSRWNVKAWRGDTSVDRQPRILFLTDRNILANQAYNAFSAFPEDAMVRIAPNVIRKKKAVPKNGNLFFTIFQTFMTDTKDAAGNTTPSFGDYPPDFFDLIIIDECHRGGANDEGSWRGIMDYFSTAVQIGLTATPKRDGNVDTYKYFGEAVYTYSLKEGINDGFLTPFRIKRIVSTLDEYTHAADDEVLEGEVEEGRIYTEAEMNRVLEIEDRERHRVKTFMNLIDQSEKTLVFCATQQHALAVRNLINQMKRSTQPNYCVRVAADDGKEGERLLSAFQDNEKNIPTILTTSRKLSTGVDARNMRNIILMRPVTSMIEFKQIVGRGTRLFDFKDYFTLYDFVKAYEHFKDPEWDGEPEVCKVCNERVCICDAGDKPTPSIRAPNDCLQPPKRAKVKLAAGKADNIQNLISTEFLGEDGKPMSVQDYLQQFYTALPEFFKDEEELRALWSQPETRQGLLDGLQAKGYAAQQLQVISRAVNAERSDLFDVLAHIAFALPPKTREERIATHKTRIYQGYNYKQREFIEFVLGHYVDDGITELAPTKLKTFIDLKYQGIRDMPEELGKAADVKKLFVEFQQRLYAPL